jgi:uncharacterized damage-inducible protein DinB
MFKTIADFEKGWTYEREATLKILRALTDASLAQAVAPGGRTLGRLAWHLVETLGEMPTHAGLQAAGPAPGTPQPQTAAEIADAYEQASRSIGDAVLEQWTDNSLAETRDMYGEVWTGGEVLSSLIAHQAHHRGQMTVLMRQAGLSVPGVYGPSKEEWAGYGMPVQD